jgi:hypothetical protein
LPWTRASRISARSDLPAPLLKSFRRSGGNSLSDGWWFDARTGSGQGRRQRGRGVAGGGEGRSSHTVFVWEQIGKECCLLCSSVRFL